MKELIKAYLDFVGYNEFSKREIVVYSIATALITIVCLCGETFF